MATRGVVAAGDAQTARAGTVALEAGGNAVDAVCAAAFASFVAELPLTGPAGAGLVLHGSAREGWWVHDFFARVPGRGGRPAELDFHPIVVDFGATTQTFHMGRGSAAVPGALPGLLGLHRAHGRLPLRAVLEPAQRLATEGWVLSEGIAYVLELLEPIYRRTPETWAMVARDGALPAPGTVSTSPGQAHLLEQLGRDPEQTLRAVAADLADRFGPGQGGLLSPVDLAGYAPTARRPLETRFAGRTVLTCPLPSAGGALIAYGLRIAEQEQLCRRRHGEHWPAMARLLGQVSKAHRSGDARHPAHLEHLLAEPLPPLAGPGEPTSRPEDPLGSTTHISVLDAEGGAAAITASNGEGCGHALPAWGIHVNNFLGEEDINPGGFHAGAPGSRMLTMMAPTVVLEDGVARRVLGSGGSNRIRSALLQTLLNELGFGLDPAAAIAADRLHVEGDRLWFEATGMSDADRRSLEAAWPGATSFSRPSMYFGGVHVAGLDRDERLFGVADARRAGAVAAVGE